MKLVIPTVQHTGTKFLADVFGKHGWEVCTFRSPCATGHGVYYGHCWPGELKYMRPLLRECRAVVPLRHPAAVYASWKARKRTHLELILQWQIMMLEVDKFDPIYLPIDHLLRNQYLDDLNKKLGTNLRTSWEPLNSFANTFNINPNDVIVPDDLIEFYNQPFFRRFYDGIRHRDHG